MKKVLLSVAVLAAFSFVSCKKGWSDAEKKAYMDACVDGAKQTLGDKEGEDYCSCTMEKIMAKYPSAKELSDVSSDEKTKVIQEVAKECLAK